MFDFASNTNIYPMKKIIKKGTLLCIVFLTLLVTFFSCSKDKSSSQPDPDPSASPKLFQHKWIFENLIVYPTIAMDPNGPTYFVLGEMANASSIFAAMEKYTI
jgi:hypothetical protein